MDFKIGFSAEDNYVSTSLPTLKPWNIYEVEFTGCEYSTFPGKKDPSITWETIKFNFKNDQGVYTETIFAPKAGDDKRNVRKTSTGHEVEQPSNLENFKYKIGHLLSVIDPRVLAKLSNKSVDFKSLAVNLSKALEASKNKKMFIKLVGDSNNRASFPYFLSLFKDDPIPKVTNNFIASEAGKLGFTDYELTKKAEKESAKPTDMKKATSTSVQEDIDLPLEEDNSDLDLDLNVD